MSISKSGQRLVDLEDWGTRAGPKSPDQWVPDQSAMEAARAWLAVESPSFPPEVAAVLATNPAFGAVRHWDGEPEVKLPFDDLPGEPRNSDLVIYAKDQYGTFLIAVEAKADEPFSDTVADTLAAALERLVENPRSNGILRVGQLARSLFGGRPPKAPQLGKLRYQLLTATAGALRAAQTRSANRVILLVHEFITKLTADNNHVRNADDLSRFVSRLSDGTVLTVEQGRLYGPFQVPGPPLLPPGGQLFIGKASRNLRAQSA